MENWQIFNNRREVLRYLGTLLNQEADENMQRIVETTPGLCGGKMFHPKVPGAEFPPALGNRQSDDGVFPDKKQKSFCW